MRGMAAWRHRPVQPDLLLWLAAMHLFPRNDQAAARRGRLANAAEGINLNDASLSTHPCAWIHPRRGVLYYGTYASTAPPTGGRWTAVSSRLSKTSDGASRHRRGAYGGEHRHVGTSDAPVQVTENAGSSWANLTRRRCPDRYVSDIAVRLADPRTAYVVFNGFDANTPSTPAISSDHQPWQDLRTSAATSPTCRCYPLCCIATHPGTIYIAQTWACSLAHEEAPGSCFSQGMPNVR